MKLRLPLILILITFFVPAVTFAQTVPPDPASVGSAKGISIAAGWNYFTIDSESCNAQKLIDELQADAGGGIAVNNLWVRQADDSWQEYTSVNPDSARAVIASGQTVALSSPGKFFFDLAAGQCQQTDADRQNQILGLRAAASGGSASDESLLDRLARVPQDFWNGLTGAFKFGKADGDLEFNKTAALDRLTVTDQTNLGSTAIGGTLTVGLITIDDLDASINSIGETLKIQSQALADVDLFGGKIILTKSGDLQINSGKIAGNSSFRGSVIMPASPAGGPAGQGSLRVDTSWDIAPVTINVTPTWNTAVWVEDLGKTGFTLRVSTTPSADSKLFWLAIW